MKTGNPRQQPSNPYYKKSDFIFPRFKNPGLAGLLAGLWLLLFVSCETEPVNVDVGDAGHILDTRHCPVDYSFTHRSQGSLGFSSKIYTGTVDSTRQSAVLLKIKSDTLAGYTAMCDLIPDSIEFVSGKLTLYTIGKNDFTTPRDTTSVDSLYDDVLPFGPDEGSVNPTPAYQSMKAYLINHSELSAGWDWDENMVFEFIDSNHVRLGNEELDLTDPDVGLELPVIINRYSVDILIEESGEDPDNPLIEQLMTDFCSTGAVNQYSIILTETDPEQEISFYSSNYPYSSTWPALDLDFKTYSEIDSVLIKYDILNVTSSQSHVFAAVDSPFTNEWGRIIALDTTGFDPVIDENEILSNIVLSTYHLELTEYEPDTSDIIGFYFANVTLANMDLDPNQDDYQFRDEYDVEDSTLTEGNGEYDFGEFYDDCGWDNICNEDEPGYNSTGSELDGNYDEGEPFYDTGLDSLWSWEEEGYDPIDNPDPNGDDFNIDPSEDNWLDCGPDRLCDGDPEYPGPDEGEQNDQWDDGEGQENNGRYDQGEIFQDTGPDGLYNEDEIGYDPVNLPDPSNDDWDPILQIGFEGDGQYNLGEPYLDAGPDGLWSPDEPGYNLDGTENNGDYDYYEIFEDTGEDGIWSAAEDGYDAELNPDPAEDDYVTDPNQDDYDSETGLGSEGNGVLDWVDAGSLDGLWTEGEGEQWYDWGTDQTPDTLETYYGGNRLITDLGDNYYEWNRVENPDTVFASWDLDDGYDAAVWISGIQTNGDETVDVQISAFTEKPIHGYQMQLVHLPFIYQDTLLTEKSASIRSVSDAKIIDDVSLFAPKSIPADELMSQSAVNYSEQLVTVMELPELHAFIDSNPDAVISRADLIFHVDTSRSSLYDEFRVIVEQLTEMYSAEEDSVQSEPVPDYAPYQDITTGTDSVIINLKSSLQEFVSGNAEFHGFMLRTDDVDHNFSTLVIHNEQDADTTKHPRLEILFSK